MSPQELEHELGEVIAGLVISGSSPDEVRIAAGDVLARYEGYQDPVLHARLTLVEHGKAAQ